MDDAVLQSLIVRFHTDLAPLVTGMRQAQSIIHRSVEALAFGGLALSIGAITEKWDKFEEMMLRLRSTIAANGREIDGAVEAYDRFIKATTDATLASGGEVRAMLLAAETRGIVGEAAERATQNAIYLARATGQDAQSMMMATIAMEQGNYHYLRRILHLHNIHDEQLLVQKAQEMINRGMVQEQALMETGGGYLTKLKRVFTSIMLDIGQVLDNIMTPIIKATLDAALFIKPYLAATWNWIAVRAVVAWELIKSGATAAWTFIRAKTQDFLDWVSPIVAAGIGYLAAQWDSLMETVPYVWEIIKQAAMDAWEYIKAIWSALSEATGITWGSIRSFVVDTFLMMEYGAQHFSDVWNVVITGAAYKLVQFGNQFVYFFSEVIPVLLTWFSNNWRDIFQTLFNWVSTIMTNMGNNIVQVIQNLPGLLARTVRWDEVWTGLNTGFESTIRELPNIPRREIGALERELEREFNAVANRLGEDWAGFRERRLREIGAFHLSLPDLTNLQNEARDLGTSLGRNYAENFQRETHKADQALFGSAEAIRRVAEYRERAIGPRGENREPLAGQNVALENRRFNQQVQEALNTANRWLAQLAGRPPAVAAPAGVANQ